VCGTNATGYTNGTTNYAGTFCASGTPTPATPSFPAAGTSVTWTCAAPNGGATISCMASQSGLTPLCDPMNNAVTYYQKRTNKNLPSPLALCSAGTATPSPASYVGGQVAVNASGAWNWSCNATTSVSCAAKHIYCGDGIVQNGTDSA
jgi:hypothetical protein